MTLVNEDIAAARRAVLDLERRAASLTRHYGDTVDAEAARGRRSPHGRPRPAVRPGEGAAARAAAPAGATGGHPRQRLHRRLLDGRRGRGSGPGPLTRQPSPRTPDGGTPPHDDHLAPSSRGRGPRRRSGSSRGRCPHAADRPLVAAAAAHGGCARGLHRLLDAARVRERELLRGAVHLAVLLALHHHALRGQPLPAAVLGSGLDQPRAVHPRGPAGLPAHLLLLPQGLLPLVLAVAAGVRRRRAAPDVQRARRASRWCSRTSTATSSTSVSSST